MNQRSDGFLDRHFAGMSPNTPDARPPTADPTPPFQTPANQAPTAEENGVPASHEEFLTALSASMTEKRLCRRPVPKGSATPTAAQGRAGALGKKRKAIDYGEEDDGPGDLGKKRKAIEDGEEDDGPGDLGKKRKAIEDGEEEDAPGADQKRQKVAPKSPPPPATDDDMTITGIVCVTKSSSLLWQPTPVNFTSTRHYFKVTAQRLEGRIMRTFVASNLLQLPDVRAYDGGSKAIQNYRDMMMMAASAFPPGMPVNKLRDELNEALFQLKDKLVRNPTNALQVITAARPIQIEAALKELTCKNVLMTLIYMVHLLVDNFESKEIPRGIYNYQTTADLITGFFFFAFTGVICKLPPSKKD